MSTIRRSRFTYLAGTLYETYYKAAGNPPRTCKWDDAPPSQQRAWLAVARRSEFEHKRAAKVTP